MNLLSPATQDQTKIKMYKKLLWIWKHCRSELHNEFEWVLYIHTVSEGE